MNGRWGIGWGRYVLAALLVPASAYVSAGCGSASSPSGTPSTAAALVTPAAAATDRPNLPSAEVMDALEGRIAAMNNGDGAAAAAFYTRDGVLEETDLSPHLVTEGRKDLAVRLTDLYDMGLRLALAGVPIACDRYVAEPVRFYNDEGGRGAGMLVFEIDADSRLAYQWMIGWAGGPEATFAILESPSVDEPNLPPDRVTKILDSRMAAMNRGDSQAAAAFYAKQGVMEEMDQSPSLVTMGPRDIAERLGDLYDAGLRLAPAGAPITYDEYVAEPVRFLKAGGTGRGAGMLVFQFDATFMIVHQWVIGWVSD